MNLKWGHSHWLGGLFQEHKQKTQGWDLPGRRGKSRAIGIGEGIALKISHSVQPGAENNSL